MARPEKIRLEVPAAIGTGRAEHVFRLIRKTVQVFGTFAATLQLEGSIDGGAFAPIGGPVTAPGFIEVPHTLEFLRVRTTAFTSGTPEAVVAGFDERAS